MTQVGIKALVGGRLKDKTFQADVVKDAMYQLVEDEEGKACVKVSV